MSWRSEKHNDPTKKKKKGRPSEDLSLPLIKKETAEPDVRRTKKLIRRRDRLAQPDRSYSKILEEQSSENVEVEESKILRIRRIRESPSEAPSEADFPDRLKRGKLKEKKSELSQLPSHGSFLGTKTPAFVPATSSSASVEVECHVVIPVKSTTIFEELPSTSSLDEDDEDLLDATYLRDLFRVKAAIERGANVNAVNKDRLTPLLIATECSDSRLINYFLRRKNVNIDHQDHHGQTALMLAIKNGLDKIAEELIYRGTSVNLRNNLGRTALHSALFYEKIYLARLLLDFGADYEIADCFGDRPMYTCAVKKPNLEGLNLLLEYGAVPDYAHATGINLLSRAIFESTKYEIIEKLIKSGANVNHEDVFTRKTPLHFAAAGNNLKITKLLLEHGANPNIETIYGYTPYDTAIFYGSLEVAQFLSEITRDAGLVLLRDLKNKKSG